MKKIFKKILGKTKCTFLIINFLIPILNSNAQDWVPMLLKNGRYIYVKFGTKDIALDKQFDDARPFVRGFAIVKSRDKWGVIDNLGKMVVAPKYTEITQLQNNYFELFDGRKRTAEDNFPRLFKIDYSNQETITSKKEGDKDTIIVKKFKISYALEFKNTILRTNFSEGKAIIEVIDSSFSNRRGKFYIVNNNLRRSYSNEINIDSLTDNHDFYPSQLEFGDCKEGFFKIRYPTSHGEERFNYLKINRDLLLEPDLYNGCYDFKEGLAKVNRGCCGSEKWGYINTKGEEVIPLIYDNLEDFHFGMAFAKIGSASGYINLKGERAFTFKEEFIGENFVNKTALVHYQQKYFFINTKGDKSMDFYEKLPKIHYLKHHSYSKGLTLISNLGDKEHMYFDEKGNMIFKINSYEASDFSNDGFAIIKDQDLSRAGKYGIINSKGGNILNSKIEKIYLLSSNYKTKLSSSELYEIIRVKGNPIEVFEESNEADALKSYNIFTNNLIIIENLGLKYFVDKNGFQYIQ